MNSKSRLGRRSFLAGLAAALPAPALVARAADRVSRVVIVARPGLDQGQATPGEVRSWDAWNDEMRRLGYTEGGNLAIERHVVEPEDVPKLVATLRERLPDAIFAPSQNIVVLLQREGIAAPVVTVAVDPVGSGLAESLARPGGRITGYSLDAGLETRVKRIALLKEASPTMTKVAFLMLRQYWDGRWRKLSENAAGSLGLTAVGALYEAGASEYDYRAIFARAAEEGADGLYLSPALETVVRRRLIAELALSVGMASVSHYRDNVEAGALMSYGADLADIYRRSARYIDRILRGDDPAEMPFQQPTKFDLTLNLATAASLGLEIPPNLLALADDVFE